MKVKKAVGFRTGFGIEPLYLGQKCFLKKPVFGAIGVPGVSTNHKKKFKFKICDFLTPQGPL
jgi:hypothetical protein